MKKFLVLLVIALFVFSGCSFGGQKKSPGTAEQGQKSAQNKQEQPEKEKKEYYIGNDAPVQGIGDYIKRYKPYEGVFMQKMGGYRVVLISMGEKFSDGYSVKVDRVIRNGEKWVVEASFAEPSQEDYSGKSTFPAETVSIIDDGRSVEVRNRAEKGKPMEVIEIPEGSKLSASKSFIIFTPLEGDKVTSPVKIRGKARVFEANFRITMEDGHYRQAEKIMMADKGAPEWGYFEASLPFKEATNPQGFVIFSYEDMKDGKMIEELLVPVKFQQ